jgi:hypothetical protein
MNNPAHQQLCENSLLGVTTLAKMDWTSAAQTVGAFGVAAAGLTGPFWNYRKWVEEQFKRISELQTEVHGETLVDIRQKFGALVQGGEMKSRTDKSKLNDRENHDFFQMLRFFQRANAVYSSFPWWSRRTRHYLLSILEPEILIWHDYLTRSQKCDDDGEWAGWTDSRGERLDADPTRRGLDRLMIDLEKRYGMRGWRKTPSRLRARGRELLHRARVARHTQPAPTQPE